ncbi:MAG TPA: hypothetical protein VN838_09515 [Bradyrhizobium sp.]|nr:hypothetical protein [Bradyrhizobium sp.]
MVRNGFVVAMAAEISFALYDRPVALLRKVKQWIIVSRCGPNLEFMTVANAAGKVTPNVDAPIGLTPIKTAVGILMSETERESTFLLVRQLPIELPVAGAFFPADGYLRIFETQGTVGLRCEGRHAHSLGRFDSYWVHKDVPNPAPNARGTMAWHVDGLRRSWAGEFMS